MEFRMEKERITALDPLGAVMGWVTFPRIRKDLVNVDTVVILPRFREADPADALLEQLFSHLEAQGIRAALTAPRAQKYVAAHPGWKKLLPESMHMTTH